MVGIVGFRDKRDKITLNYRRLQNEGLVAW